jgi:hypothetical protein
MERVTGALESGSFKIPSREYAMTRKILRIVLRAALAIVSVPLPVNLLGVSVSAGTEAVRHLY